MPGEGSRSHITKSLVSHGEDFGLGEGTKGCKTEDENIEASTAVTLRAMTRGWWAGRNAERAEPISHALCCLAGADKENSEAEASPSPMRTRSLPAFHRAGLTVSNASRFFGWYPPVCCPLAQNGLMYGATEHNQKKTRVLTSGTLKQNLVLSAASEGTLLFQKPCN